MKYMQPHITESVAFRTAKVHTRSR